MALRVAAQKTIALQEMGMLDRRWFGCWARRLGPMATLATFSPSNPAASGDLSDPESGDSRTRRSPSPGPPETDDPVRGRRRPAHRSARPAGDDERRAENGAESRGRGETATPDGDPDPDEEEPVGPPDETEDPDRRG